MSDLDFPARMSDSDALMWSIEKDPLLRSTITTVLLLDRTPDRERLAQRLHHATNVIPRLRQRVLGHPYSVAPPRWEVDPNFDLSFHLRHVRAPGDGSLRDVFDLSEPIAMQGFDRARPLWEFVVVEGLADGRAALVEKVHHAITDGVGGVKLQMEVLDLERDSGDRGAETGSAPSARQPGELRRMIDAATYESRRQAGHAQRLGRTLWDTARRAAGDPVGVAHEAVTLAGSTARLLAPATEPLSPVLRGRSLSVRFDSMTLDLERTKRAAKVVGGTLNDAFVAGVAGGLRRYHRHHGTEVEALRMTMPINVRSGRNADVAGNQFVPARFEIPIADEDPIAQLTAIGRLLDQQKHEPSLSLTEPIAGVLSRLPTTMTTSIFGAMLKGIDLVTTNVPGPPVPVYVAGARMERQFAFGPMTGAAMNIALLSYVDEIALGINSDPAAVPDPDVLVTCLEESFDELLDIA